MGMYYNQNISMESIFDWLLSEMDKAFQTAVGDAKQSISDFISSILYEKEWGYTGGANQIVDSKAFYGSLTLFDALNMNLLDFESGVLQIFDEYSRGGWNFSVISGDANVGLFSGAGVGVRLFSAGIELKTPLQIKNKTLTIRFEGELGGIGADAHIIEDGGFRIGKSKGIGGYVSVLWK